MYQYFRQRSVPYHSRHPLQPFPRPHCHFPDTDILSVGQRDINVNIHPFDDFFLIQKLMWLDTHQKKNPKILAAAFFSRPIPIDLFSASTFRPSTHFHTPYRTKLSWHSILISPKRLFTFLFALKLVKGSNCNGGKICPPPLPHIPTCYHH